MNSLRTDDIIGAIPRVRHMPKNLFRQRNYDQYQETNMTRNSLPGSIPYHNLEKKYPYNDNFYPNFPLSQYDPVPFIPAANENDKNQYLNGSYRYQNSQSNGFYDDKRLSSPKILKKEALFTSYDQISELQKMKTNYQNKRSSSPMLIKNSQNIKSQGQLAQHEKHFNPQIKTLDAVHLTENNQKINHIRNSSRSSQKSSHSNQNLNASQQLKKDPNINIAQKSSSTSQPTIQNKKQRSSYFRGLGFNIITNNKFQFNVQTRLDPSFLQREKTIFHH